MGKVEPTLYQEYISTDNKGQPVLYVWRHKAIYKLLKSTLLFYQILRGLLEQKGFKVIPYDPCGTKKWINRAKVTMAWHVGNVKVSHRDPQCVTEVIKWLSSLYREPED